MNYIATTAAIIVMRCDMILEHFGIENSLNGFPVLQDLITRAGEAELKEWAGAEEDSTSPYMQVVKLFNGDRVLRSLLDLCITVHEYPEFSAALIKNLGHGVNFRLAFLMEGIDPPPEDEVIKKAETAKLYFNFDMKAAPLSYTEISLDERLAVFLHGGQDMSPLISDITGYYKARKQKGDLLIINKELVDEGIRHLKAKGKVLQLSGRGGRRFIAERIADGIKKDFLFIDIRDLLHEAGKDQLDRLRDTLIREALLSGAGIVFYGIDDYFLKKGRGPADISESLSKDLKLLERKLFLPVKDAGVLQILCTDHKKALLKNTDITEFRNLRLPEVLKLSDRQQLWKEETKKYDPGFDPDEMALRYRLNASEISRVMKSYMETVSGDSSEDDSDLLTRLCIEELMGETESGIGRIIFPDTRLEDVRVKDNVRNILLDVLSSVKTGALIMEEWDLKRSYPYGRCVSLLMSGPPGTGKTMTANAIAGELKLPLYQVNLSNVVDKYIGETEKNLEKAFEYAEKTNSVLFFDEADALFGTRSEVHDSKDKYANTEVAYLLQRIEAYDGIVILATNIKSNIDPAFMRRIRYVVRFENPDEELRREIWMSCVGEAVPHEDIDFDYLASQFDDFTGSIIKTVFLNACAYAAGKNEALSMKHLVHAIKHEVEKSSSVSFSMDTLGKYAYLL